MRSLVDAVTFLTRVPLPVDRRRLPDLPRAAGWFPAVGAVLGLGLGLLVTWLDALTGAWVAAALTVTAHVALTGALHLDGLADLADGSGGRDREHRLRIMKDPGVGVYGTAAVVLALLLETALLVQIVEARPVPASGWLPAWAGPGLLGATAWSLSRASVLPVALLLPYAREEGTGRAVVQGLTAWRTLVACVLPLALCGLLGATGVAMVAGAALGTLAVGLVGRRLLGGATGDVLGATAQVALLGALLGALLAVAPGA